MRALVKARPRRRIRTVPYADPLYWMQAEQSLRSEGILMEEVLRQVCRWAIVLMLAGCAGRQAALVPSVGPASAPDTRVQPNSGPSVVEIASFSANPSGIASDQAGNEWVALLSPATLVRVNETTHAKTSYGLPNSQSEPETLALGVHGNGLWFTEYRDDTVGYMHLADHSIHRYAVPTHGAGVFGIAAGPDNAMWFTESSAGKIGRIDLSSFAITEYPISSNPYPYNIALGSDGALWFTEVRGNAIGRIATNGHVSQYALPHADSVPWGISTGADGGVWFTENNLPDAAVEPANHARALPDSAHHGRIGRIDPTTHAISEWSLPSAAAGPEYIVGRGSDLWFTEYAGNGVGSINDTSHAIHEYSAPAGASGPYAIALGTDDQLWFTQAEAKKLGKICPTRSANQCTTGD